MAKKEYFIEQNGKKQGAFTLEELIKLDIYDDAMVWKAGWEDWKQSTEVDELTEYVIIKPPPTKQEKAVQEIRAKKNSLIEHIKLKYPKFIIGFIVSTLFLNLILFITAKDGGTADSPIYLTYEERINPSIIFWKFLPYTMALVGSVSLALLLMSAYFSSQKLVIVNGLVKTRVKTPYSTNIEYEKEYQLYGDKVLQVIKFINSWGLTEVRINHRVPEDGIYMLVTRKKALEIKDGFIEKIYSINSERIDKDLIEIGLFEDKAKKGYPVWLNHQIAPNGVFKTNKYGELSVRDGGIA